MLAAPGYVMLNGEKLTREQLSAAGIATADISASNGIVHVINHVLLPSFSGGGPEGWSADTNPAESNPPSGLLPARPPQGRPVLASARPAPPRPVPLSGFHPVIQIQNPRVARPVDGASVRRPSPGLSGRRFTGAGDVRARGGFRPRLVEEHASGAVLQQD